MASLIPESSKTDFKTALNDHFDTFKETITIFKEPKKVITNQSQSIYAGYGAQKEIIELKKNSIPDINNISKEIAANIIENISGEKLNNIHEACAESQDYLFELRQVTKKTGTQ